MALMTRLAGVVSTGIRRSSSVSISSAVFASSSKKAIWGATLRLCEARIDQDRDLLRTTSHRFNQNRATGKAIFVKTWLKRIFLLALLLFLAPFVLVPVFGFLNPPVTVFQMAKSLQGLPINSSWRTLLKVSRHLPAAVIASEDARFCAHNGVDWRAVQTVVEDKLENPDQKVRGASTITMQWRRICFFLLDDPTFARQWSCRLHCGSTCFGQSGDRLRFI